ncbi:MAG: decaprenylphospho-beta-D-erythro-pentofuranosid-2-ulose 2-reductase [Actinomycetes bacterium]
MIDALGHPQSILVLGGTSDIALATVQALVAGRTRLVVLAGRGGPRLDQAAERVRAAGADAGGGPVVVRTVEFDAEELATHRDVLDAAFDGADIDVVLLAFGVLPDPERAATDPEYAAATALVNYVGAVSAGTATAVRLRAQGHGILVVLSSVAGERVRRSNFVYGSTKAGLDGWASGLGEYLAGTGVRVVVVRPGFVTTKMTAGLPKAPLSSTPEQVAAAIVTAIARPRPVVWVPATLRPVMSLLRHLPRPVFARLPL